MGRALPVTPKSDLQNREIKSLMISRTTSARALKFWRYIGGVALVQELSGTEYLLNFFEIRKLQGGTIAVFSKIDLKFHVAFSLPIPHCI